MGSLPVEDLCHRCEDISGMVEIANLQMFVAYIFDRSKTRDTKFNRYHNFEKMKEKEKDTSYRSNELRREADKESLFCHKW